MQQDDINSRILYFDKDFCVVTKFAGENSETDIPKIFHSEILERCGKLGIKKNEIKIACPHRLDMCVSGVQIICFTKESFSFFSSQFASDKIQKTYFAIVEGVFSTSENCATLENFIIFNPKTKKAKIVDSSDVGKNKAKKAILSYKIFGSGKNYSYLEVFPQTGRTHQIRCQLAYNKMHIKGDVKYGSPRSDSIPGIRLHSYAIEFFPPCDSTKKIKICSPIPVVDSLWQDFLKTCDAKIEGAKE